MLRDYQQDASDAAVACLKRGMWNGLLVMPTACGKSFVIADIASRLDSPLIVFAPTREIVLQNYEKIRLAGMNDVGIYSASLGEKNIRKITLATIGSVHNHMEDFRLFKYVIVDEAHRVDASSGMYRDYLTAREDRCVIGLTATPYRLSGFMGCTKTTFLTRLQPRIYDKVVYVCQVNDMMDRGYLCKPQYFDMIDKIAFKLKNVKLNTTGMDYDEKSLQEEYERSNFARDLLSWTLMVLKPNDGSERNGVVVFTRFVREAEVLKAGLRGHGVIAETVTAKTPNDVRKAIVDDFRCGRIKVVANAGCLGEGFDYPALDTVIIASPTRSLTRWCQMVGRILRPYSGKKAWVLDLSGNYRKFGKMEDMRIENLSSTNQWVVTSRGRQLTGIMDN